MTAQTEARPAAAPAPTRRALAAPSATLGATPGARPPSMALPSEFLSFRIGAEEYGIDILRVQEIRSHEPPTRIANAPPMVQGVVNLRGVIVPVVDLRLALSCASVDCTELTVVVVLNLRGRVIGAVVDAVSDVLALSPDQIKPAPALRSDGAGTPILGLGCVRSGEVERMLILIDIEALLRGADLGLVDERAA